ncbi:MAG: TauD/TfdA family dioxygenase [Pseudomonadota bacterium]
MTQAAEQTDTAQAKPDWTTRPIKGAFGLEIIGLNLATATATQAGAVEQLFNRHGALLFRGQDLAPQDLVAFSRHFGALDEAPVNEEGKTAIDGLPELYVVSNIKGSDGKALGSLGAGEAVWHTDMSYLETPPKASMLYALEIPAEGGNTWLADMYAALADMPADLRARIEGRRIKHDGTFNSAGLLRQGLTECHDPRASVGTYHPIICTHEDTGKEVLYLGRRRNAYVEGLDLEASETLLDDLWAHAAQPAFAYEHSWRVGDVLMWDNRATLHRRDPFDPEARRYMLRTQIKSTAAPRMSAPAG